ADGLSGVHTHMTNSLNTPVEALEFAYPFRVRKYAYRAGSGGGGRFRGGNGLIREIELLGDAQITLLADRRKRGPYGLNGGAEGAPGRTLLLRRNGAAEELPGKCSVNAKAGDAVRIESPGGGGWGKRQSAKNDEPTTISGMPARRLQRQSTSSGATPTAAKSQSE